MAETEPQDEARPREVFISRPPSYPSTMYGPGLRSVRIINDRQFDECWKQGWRRNPEEVGISHEDYDQIRHDGFTYTNQLREQAEIDRIAMQDAEKAAKTKAELVEAENEALRKQLADGAANQARIAELLEETQKRLDALEKAQKPPVKAAGKTVSGPATTRSK